jgi:hypothetical protein
MAVFLVIVPHEPSDCLEAIKDTISMGPGFEAAYEWGCLVGDHTGYVRVQAGGIAEAIGDYVPAFLRTHATALRVENIDGRQLMRMRRDRGED